MAIGENPSHHPSLQSKEEIGYSRSPSARSSCDNPVMQDKSPEEGFPSYQPETENQAPAVVPRSKRRGLFGQFTLLAEVENPKTYPRKIKWFITFIVAVAAAAAPLGSSIFFRELLP